MAALIINPDAEDDLERLWRLDRWSATRIIALLEEIEGNDDLLDRLSQDYFHRDAPRQFDVRRWVEAWNSGSNLFRLKVWDPNDDLLPYRVIYAFLPNQSEYHVLAVVHREWNYDPEHKLSHRIFQAYDEL